MNKTILAMCALAGASLTSAYGSTVTFQTPAGSSLSAGAVSASAVVTTNAGSVTVTLNDLLANTANAGQLLSDFSFTLGTGSFGSVASSITPTGVSLIDIASNKTVSVDHSAVDGWGLFKIGNTVYLESLVGGSDQAIIGPGPYTNANGSIAGNPAHNPFIDQTATFTIALSGVTASTTVTSAVFSFGTTLGNDVAGVVVPPAATPEPGTWMLSLAGTGLVGLSRLRKSRKA